MSKQSMQREFFEREFFAMQFVSINQLTPEKDHQNNESVCETAKDVDTLRKSVRQRYKYKSSWVDDNKKRCIKIHQSKADYYPPKRFL